MQRRFRHIGRSAVPSTRQSRFARSARSPGPTDSAGLRGLDQRRERVVLGPDGQTSLRELRSPSRPHQEGDVGAALHQRATVIAAERAPAPMIRNRMTGLFVHLRIALPRERTSVILSGCCIQPSAGRMAASRRSTRSSLNVPFQDNRCHKGAHCDIREEFDPAIEADQSRVPVSNACGAGNNWLSGRLSRSRRWQEGRLWGMNRHPARHDDCEGSTAVVRRGSPDVGNCAGFWTPATTRV